MRLRASPSVELPHGAFMLLTVDRVRFRDCRVHDRCNCDPWTYCYTLHDGVGMFPGTDSDEWIEYVPPTLYECTRCDGRLHTQEQYNIPPVGRCSVGCRGILLPLYSNRDPG